MFSTDTLKSTCEQTMISLISSLKCMEKQTHDMITKDRVGGGELAFMMKFTKKGLTLPK